MDARAEDPDINVAITLHDAITSQYSKRLDISKTSSLKSGVVLFVMFLNIIFFLFSVGYLSNTDWKDFSINSSE